MPLASNFFLKSFNVYVSGMLRSRDYLTSPFALLDPIYLRQR